MSIMGTEAELEELLVDEPGRVVVPADVPMYFVPRIAQTLYPDVGFIASIPAIYETRSFQKDISRLPRSVQNRWAVVRQVLARSTRTQVSNSKSCEVPQPFLGSPKSVRARHPRP